jgi:hypothetical protein
MYYGNAAAADQQDVVNVWNTPNYSGVWHLKESASPSANSTSAGLTGAWVPTTSIGTGRVGDGLTFGAGTGESNVSSTFGLGITNVTMECWANITSLSQKGAFIKIGGTSPNQGYGIGVGNGTFETPGSSFLVLLEGRRWITAGTFTTGWHHFANVINASGFSTAFIDGLQVYNETSGTLPLAPSSSITKFGGYTGSAGAATENRHFTGTLDEIRISPTVRSNDWLRTGFNNQNSPSTFYSVSVEAALPTITLGTIASICPGSTTFQIPYTATGSPDQYSISGTGITTVTNQPLGASPISITLSSPASPGSMPFVISVRNSGSGVSSVNVNGSVTVTSLPVATVAGQSNVKCFGASDGTITIDASGGTSPYSYSVDNGVNYTPSATDPYVYPGLIANQPYQIRVKDSKGCESRSVQ